LFKTRKNPQKLVKIRHFSTTFTLSVELVMANLLKTVLLVIDNSRRPHPHPPNRLAAGDDLFKIVVLVLV
jgi:hypothetical protein